MTSNQPNPANPTFHTPQPNELQSEESKEATWQNLAKRGTETDTIDDRKTEDANNLADKVNVIENMDNLADRHLPSIDSPPG
jgi:hypothetical protein